MPWIPCAYPPCGRLHRRPPSDLARGIRHCSAACRRLNLLAGGWTLLPPGQRVGRRKYVWEPWMDDVLRRDYDSHPATLDRLEQQLRVPRHAIKQRARRLGLQRTRAALWTETDEAYLRQWIGRKALREIAQHLGRTKEAVWLKAKRLHLNQSQDGYTARALEVLLGWEVHTTTRLIGKGWLKATRRHTERTAKQGGDLWHIAERDLRACILAHPELVNPRRLGDWPWFLDLVTDGKVTAAALHAAHQGA